MRNPVIIEVLDTKIIALHQLTIDGDRLRIINKRSWKVSIVGSREFLLQLAPGAMVNLERGDDMLWQRCKDE